MSGEPIRQVMNGVDMLTWGLKTDPKWPSYWLSAIAFHTTAQQEIPLTALMDFVPPRLTANGNSALGAALRVLMDCIRREVRLRDAAKKIQGDWNPAVFLFTNGQPDDDWQNALADFREFVRLRQKKPADYPKFLRPSPWLVIACGTGPQANQNVLRQITETVLDISSSTANDWTKFFIVTS